MRPVATLGAFLCSDTTLSTIWGTAAYTTRLCQQGLSLDGVKRDRMPWAGDLALSLLTNAFTLADVRSASDTLTALGSTVEVRPLLGDLDWAAAVVPTPHGDLVVIANGPEIRADAPDGVRVIVREDSPAAE